MKQPDSWIPITERSQYTMLGFKHKTENLLYVEDYRNLKCCPKNEAPDYLWADINLSKGPAFPKVTFSLGEHRSKDPEFVLWRAHCNGVKVGFCSMNILIFHSNFKHLMITGVSW
jgi:hypothetical protein